MIGRVEEGRRMIKDRLHHRKVLLVLDDVNHLDQLLALAGSHKWFGEGSRIIITTRDEHVLKGHTVDVIHNVSLLNNDEAMKLFSLHAPPVGTRIEDYEQLSKDVISYAGGLPLALRVLGRFLCDKETSEWRSAMARLREIPDDEILEKLKISFDGLKTVEKQLFLDIACFYRWHVKDDEEIMMKLEACGFYPVIGINVLIQKALITISEDGEFDMHDLVQEMAHYIVRGEHPNNPEKHSRIWEDVDVLKICAMDATTNMDNIEAILFPKRGIDDVCRFLSVAANMKKLRCVDLYTVKPREVEDLPLVIMPENFPPTELCFLELKGLNAEQLWEGYKFLPNLRIIQLYGVSSLMKTPHFGGLRNLERFVVFSCPLLAEIHPSFGDLEKLVYVKIKWCNNLEMLPPVTQSKKLTIFKLSWCNSVFKHLKIKQRMENCLPHNMNHIGLWFISRSLSKLDLSHCNLADEDIRSPNLWELPNLQELNLEGNKFVRLNFSLLCLPRLKWLNVTECSELVELLELPSSIAVVIADGCRSLERFGDISNCEWLWKVSVTGENKLGLYGGLKLLKLMLQGNAKDYFISFNVKDIETWRPPSVIWVDWVKPYDMLLPNDWYNRFSGILMFVQYPVYSMARINISIKHGVVNDFPCEIDESVNDDDDFTVKCVGYVSFSSLRRIGCLNLTYNMISFSEKYGYVKRCRFRVVLVHEDDPMQTTKVTTDSSEFWDEEQVYEGKTFTIDHVPNSSIEILWDPVCHNYPRTY